MRLEAAWIARDLTRYRGLFRLRVLSAHRRVINLAVEGWPHFLVLAGPEVYREPAAIGLTGEALAAAAATIGRISEGRFAEGALLLEGPGVRAAAIWSGKAVFSFDPPARLTAHPGQVCENLARCRAALLKRPPASAAAVLLEAPGGEAYFREAFRIHFPALLAALADPREEEFWRSGKSILGMGRGSTPTGDDLICGALLACRYRAVWERRAWRPPAVPPWVAAATTPLSAHGLELSRRGLAAEPLREHLSSLLSGEWEPRTLDKLLGMGSSTGYDLAVAVQLALESGICRG